MEPTAVIDEELPFADLDDDDNPALRLVFVKVSPPGTIIDPNEQATLGILREPSNVTYTTLTLGTIDPVNLSVIVDEAAQEAAAPLAELRRQLESGNLFNQANQLRGQIEKTESEMLAARATADEALARVEDVLREGGDVTMLENTARGQRYKTEIAENRLKILRKLHAEAQDDARRILSETLDNRQAELLAAAQAKDAELSAQLASVIANLLPDVLRVKAAKNALMARQRDARLLRQTARLVTTPAPASDHGPAQRPFFIDAISGSGRTIPGLIRPAPTPRPTPAEKEPAELPVAGKAAEPEPTAVAEPVVS